MAEAQAQSAPFHDVWVEAHLDAFAMWKKRLTEMIEQLALAEIAAPMTVLTVGYTLTLAEDEIASVVVVCRQPEPVYFYEIYRRVGGHATSTEVVPLPGMPPKAPRVVSKRVKESEASPSKS